MHKLNEISKAIEDVRGCINAVAQIIAVYAWDEVLTLDNYNGHFAEICADEKGRLYLITDDFASIVVIECSWPFHQIVRQIPLTGLKLHWVVDMVYSDNCIFLTETNLAAVCCIDLETGHISLFAGQSGVKGKQDGVGQDALFRMPFGIDIDRNTQSLYVCDQASDTIRKISRNGRVSTIANIKEPYSMAYMDRSLYVLADAACAQIHKFKSNKGGWSSKSIWPSQRTSVDGILSDGHITTATYNNLLGFVFDKCGRLYVADQLSLPDDRVIRVISPGVDIVTTIRDEQTRQPLMFGVLQGMTLGGPSLDILYVLHGRLSESKVTVVPIKQSYLELNKCSKDESEEPPKKKARVR